MSENNLRRGSAHGFTIVELLVIAPIVILTITAFISVIVNMTGDVLASRSSNLVAYDIQDALSRIEEDVKLSSTFWRKILSPQPPQVKPSYFLRHKATTTIRHRLETLISRVAMP